MLATNLYSIFKRLKLKMEQKILHAIMLYEFKLGHNVTDASENINRAWGKKTTTERTVRRWFQRFQNGDMSLVEASGRGRVASVDNDHLRTIVEGNPRTTVRELAEIFSASISTVSVHLKQIGKVKKLDKWIPHELSEDQRNRRFEVCSALLLRNKNDPFLDRVVTCDEKWLLYDNRKRSAQWLDQTEAPKHFPKPNLHQQKIMVSVWWFAGGIIYHKFLDQGCSIDAKVYCSELEEMNIRLRDKQPRLINQRGPILLHDNARPHVAQLTLQKLNDLGFEILPHPPYSPDLSPTDYHLFKHLDHFLHQKQFATKSDIENGFEDFLKSRTPDFFWDGINNLISRWQKCLGAHGAYFN